MIEAQQIKKSINFEKPEQTHDGKMLHLWNAPGVHSMESIWGQNTTMLQPEGGTAKPSGIRGNNCSINN